MRGGISSHGHGILQWVLGPDPGISYRKNTNLQLGARFTKMLSQQSFYEIKLNALRTNNRIGTSPWYNTITDQVRNMETGTAIITRTMNFMYYQAMTGKTFLLPCQQPEHFTDEKTTTLSLDANFTSQVTAHI